MLHVLEGNRCLLVVCDIAAVPSMIFSSFTMSESLDASVNLSDPLILLDSMGTLPQYQGICLLYILGEHPLLFDLNVDGQLPQVDLALVWCAPSCPSGVVVDVDHNELQLSDRFGYARAIRVCRLNV